MPDTSNPPDQPDHPGPAPSGQRGDGGDRRERPADGLSGIRLGFAGDRAELGWLILFATRGNNPEAAKEVGEALGLPENAFQERARRELEAMIRQAVAAVAEDEESALEILAVIHGPGSANDKGHKILAIDHRWANKNSDQWGRALGISGAAFRQTQLYRETLSAIRDMGKQRRRTRQRKQAGAEKATREADRRQEANEQFEDLFRRAE